MIHIPITILPHGHGLPLPAYATPGAAGLDAVAAVTDTHMLQPGARFAVPLGICMAIPEGFEVQVRPRSGLALKHGISMPNSPGTIDSDYRGEVKALLINLGQEAFAIERGMRICQLVPAAVTRAALAVVDVLDETQRGSGGFGSTGVHT
ncbi:dUTP diphosphatase [Sandarakinorhabdus sp.]|uniref:dUTP diphosphatase n=1 Tax=Sandarakinorhabdus sp. TaxID=1916663 RepID=UPI003F722102